MCVFLEEEIPGSRHPSRIPRSSSACLVSAPETQRLSELAVGCESSLPRLTAEWEELMLQLEGA